MKRLIMCLVMLVIAAGISFSLDIYGSSAITGYGNADSKTFEGDQEINIDLNALHFDVDGGLDYALPGKEWSWDYTIGAIYSASIFQFGGTISGDNEVKLGDITTTADAIFGGFGLNGYLELSADKAKNVFRGVDVSATWACDFLELRFGMTYLDDLAFEDDVGYVNAPAAMEGVGMYGIAKVIY